MKKKILILGSNPETIPLVVKAKQKGLITYVVGKEKKSLCKTIADHSILGDASNVKFVNNIIKKYSINAVMVGTVDVLINAYNAVCAKNNLPCYTNNKAINAFSSKKNFSLLCKKFGFKQIPDYTKKLKKNIFLPVKLFPVLVKPADSGGGVGAQVCNNNRELKYAIKIARNFSKKKIFLCQDYFLEDDIQLYYTIVNKKLFLSCVVDRSTNKTQNNKSPVCVGASYNSKYINLVLKKYHNKFKKMINYLGIINGILSIQCFIKNNEIYPYDPGFRLQGEGQHIVLNKINKFDHLDMLLNLSLGEPFFTGNFKKFNDPFMKNKFVASVWILLKAGKIHKIYNLNKIKNHNCYLGILQRFYQKEKIKKSYIGTEKQVFARIYLAAEKKSKLISAISYIHEQLKIENDYKKNLILDKFVLSY
jgi:hypothetical protein